MSEKKGAPAVSPHELQAGKKQLQEAEAEAKGKHGDKEGNADALEAKNILHSLGK